MVATSYNSSTIVVGAMDSNMIGVSEDFVGDVNLMGFLKVTKKRHLTVGSYSGCHGTQPLIRFIP